ncbi:MAG: PSD1 domain-containing protein [Verrucomicrobiales bacterium]|nr:PSD1 domain-containing protein [Verrucomicrobiales bacterium]
MSSGRSASSSMRLRVARVLSALGIALLGSSGARGVDFQRDVRPILSQHCFACHGPDEAARKAKLRLDTRAGTLGIPGAEWRAVVPGKPDESPVIQRIFTTDPEDQMPPASAKKPLSEAQKEILKRWVAEGAEYTEHWAFIKPEQPAPPAVKQADWPRNPIDHFILNRLETEGLKPQSRADRHTLVRRVYLDLIGLPPTPEQADAFVRDESPEAFEKLVDGLLASPHYGERWARRWLDLARYADTNGYEKDRERSIWAYRDWVINAMNAGMPFDEFTVEQIAGDLLPDATLEQRIATGFHRNTMINEEGGNDPLEFRFYSMVDRVNVTATAWLGLTMGCGQCHSHKYDPIQQTEYYRFMALLNNADEPWIDVPQPDVTAAREAKRTGIERLEASLVQRFPREVKADWMTPATSEFASAAGTDFERLTDGSFRLNGPAADKDVYTVNLDTSLDRVTHLQVQVLPDPALVKNGPGRSDGGNFVLTEIELTAAPLDSTDAPKPVKLARARADFSQDNYPAWKAIDGRDDTGWGISGPGDWHVARTLTVEFAEPVTFPGGARLALRLKQQFGKQHLIGRLRLALGRELPDDRPIELRRREHLDYRLARWVDGQLPLAVNWQPATPDSAEGSHPTLAIEADDTVFASGDFTKNDTYTVKFNGDWNGVRALRIEVLPDERLPNNGPGRVDYEGPFGDFFMSDVTVRHGEDKLAVQSASDSYHSGGNDAAKAIDDDRQSGWSINGGQGRAHDAVFVFAEPLAFEGELTLQLIFEKYYAAGLGRFRVSVTRDEGAVASGLPNGVRTDLLALRDGLKETRRLPVLDRLRDYYVTIAPELAEELDEIERLKRSIPKHPTTLVMQERPPGHTRPTFVHKRGEFLQPTTEVTPGVPAFLPGFPEDAPANRLTLARWLVSPDNPLTARVTMNRAWEAFFGRGIVRTLDDFGFQGEAPSNPRLLDWLAVEFMNRGWSMKQMHRLIVLSATYQQSSHVTPERLQADPENVLLSRGPRFRMEAELLRDSALAVSGLLSPKLGGPSVFPPQLASITTEGAYGPLTWRTSQGEDRYRRSLYTFAKRTAPFAMHAAFDAPSGETCVARRERSNTPLQSLTLLNDEMFLETARALGTEIAGTEGAVEERAADLFRRCLSRAPSPDELGKLVDFYRKQRQRFEAGELSAKDLLTTEEGGNLKERAAWTTLARVLMNLDEFVTRS